MIKKYKFLHFTHFEVQNLPHFHILVHRNSPDPDHCNTCTIDSMTVRLFVNVGEAVDPFFNAEQNII